MEKQPSWQGKGDSKKDDDDDVLDDDNDKDVNKDRSTTTMNMMTGQHGG